MEFLDSQILPGAEKESHASGQMEGKESVE